MLIANYTNTAARLHKQGDRPLKVLRWKHEKALPTGIEPRFSFERVGRFVVVSHLNPPADADAATNPTMTRTGKPIIKAGKIETEPGERWFYDYRTGEFFAGPKLHAPHSHPLDQPVPGPAEAVPSNWQTLLHE
jgi:hypothetical protein